MKGSEVLRQGAVNPELVYYYWDAVWFCPVCPSALAILRLDYSQWGTDLGTVLSSIPGPSPQLHCPRDIAQCPVEGIVTHR